MEIFLWTFLALVYLSGSYLHRLVYRALAAIVVAAPTNAIWVLSILWPVVDIYLAIAIAHGAYVAGKK